MMIARTLFEMPQKSLLNCSNSNQSTNGEISGIKFEKTHSRIEDHERLFITTPQFQSKLDSSEIEDEGSFCLDDIFKDDLSHISENGTDYEKWHEESIDCIVYEKKDMELEEDRKQQDAHVIQILQYEPAQPRLPMELLTHIQKNQYKVICIAPLKLQCKELHSWETYLENLQTCKLCTRAANQKKLYCQYEREQNELYLQATRKLQSPEQTRDRQKVIRAFREMEIEVDQAALAHAKRFCAKSGTDNQSQIQSVYKLLLLPERVIQQYIYAQSKTQLKVEYRHYARLVHPDKNRHPQAGVAFKKLKKFWFEQQKSQQK